MDFEVEGITHRPRCMPKKRHARNC